MHFSFRDLNVKLQYSYTSEQYTDATNAEEAGPTAIDGLIPAYGVMDFSLSLPWKKWAVYAGVNNVLNNYYFTRRATGYPGPGIIPSDGRSFYLGLQLKL